MRMWVLIGRQPVQIVDWPLAREHVVDLALHPQGPSVYLDLLGRFPSQSEIARFPGKHL